MLNSETHKLVISLHFGSSVHLYAKGCDLGPLIFVSDIKTFNPLRGPCSILKRDVLFLFLFCLCMEKTSCIEDITLAVYLKHRSSHVDALIQNRPLVYRRRCIPGPSQSYPCLSYQSCIVSHHLEPSISIVCLLKPAV